MTGKRLILLGGSVRAAAASAVRAGFEPYAIDQFADRDLAALGSAIRLAQFPRGLTTALAAAPQAPWMYTGGLENHPRLIERLAKIRPLLGNAGDSLRGVRDPQQLAEVCREAGCPAPRLATTAGADLAGAAQWLIKPRRSTGGLRVRFAETGELAQVPVGCYLQEFVAGQASSAVFVAARGSAILLGVTRQLLGSDFQLPRPFLYAGSIGPLPVDSSLRLQLQRLGQLLAQRFALVGLFNIDFVVNDAGIWIIEVNPRYSASVEVLERAAELRAIRLHVQACADGLLPEGFVAQHGRCVGKAVVYARQDCLVPAALDDLVENFNRAADGPTIADLPRVGDALQAGQPVVTVLAERDSIAAVERELRQRMKMVQALLRGA